MQITDGKNSQFHHYDRQPQNDRGYIEHLPERKTLICLRYLLTFSITNKYTVIIPLYPSAGGR